MTTTGSDLGFFGGLGVCTSSMHGLFTNEGQEPPSTYRIFCLQHSWQDSPVVIVKPKSKKAKKKNSSDSFQPPSSHSHSTPLHRQFVHMCFSSTFPFPYPAIPLGVASSPTSNTLWASSARAIHAVTLRCNSSSSCFCQAANASAFLFFSASFQATSSASAFHRASSASIILWPSSASSSLQAFLASASLQTLSASATFRASSSCCLCHSSFARFTLSSMTSCSRIRASSSSNEIIAIELCKVFTLYQGSHKSQRTLTRYIWYQRCSKMTGVMLYDKEYSCLSNYSHTHVCDNYYTNCTYLNSII